MSKVIQVNFNKVQRGFGSNKIDIHYVHGIGYWAATVNDLTERFWTLDAAINWVKKEALC